MDNFFIVTAVRAKNKKTAWQQFLYKSNYLKISIQKHQGVYILVDEFLNKN